MMWLRWLSEVIITENRQFYFLLLNVIISRYSIFFLIIGTLNEATAQREQSIMNLERRVAQPSQKHAN